MGYFLVNLGLVYFVAFGSDGVADASLELLFGWRFIGVIMVPYLVFVEVFVIRAICVYCTMMHVAMIVDFIVVSYLLFFGKNTMWRDEAGAQVANETAATAGQGGEDVPPPWEQGTK